MLPDPKRLCKVRKYADPNILENVEDLEGVERSAVSPQLSNFLCDKRVLKGFDMNMLRMPLDADEKARVENALNITEETLDEFSGSPLKQLLGFVTVNLFNFRSVPEVPQMECVKLIIWSFRVPLKQFL